MRQIETFIKCKSLFFVTKNGGISMSVMLDKRDSEIMVYINSYRLGHRGTPPIIKEISDALEFASTGSVYNRLLKLQVAGYLDKEPKVSRSLIVTAEGLAFIRKCK